MPRRGGAAAASGRRGAARRPRGGRDRARLSLRLRAARGPARGVPDPGAGGARAGAPHRDPHPRGGRGHLRGSGGGAVPPRAGGHCFTGDAATAHGRDLGLPVSSRASRRSGAETCARRPPSCRGNGCSSRPTPRTWRRSRIGGAATSRRGWPVSSTWWRRCGGRSPARCQSGPRPPSRRSSSAPLRLGHGAYRPLKGCLVDTWSATVLKSGARDAAVSRTSVPPDLAEIFEPIRADLNRSRSSSTTSSRGSS